ncbi:MAG: hypothetical protein ACFWTK_06995 [Clostridium sp.]|jgi:hypothetical protein
MVKIISVAFSIAIYKLRFITIINLHGKMEDMVEEMVYNRIKSITINSSRRMHGFLLFRVFLSHLHIN